MDETTGSAVASESAATPASAPSPVATPAPTVSSTADTPSSFAEALTAKMTAPAPVAPAPQTPASEPKTADAIAQPPATPATPETVTTPVEPAKQGPIPFERHESILKNARAKTEQEVMQRVQTQYGPSIELGQRFTADPVGTMFGLLEGLAQHSEHGTTVRSQLARMLGARGRQPATTDAAPESEPQADLQTPDGTLVYSAPQLAKREAWARQQIERAIEQRLQPLQEREQQRVAQERLTQAQASANERMAKVLAPYKQLLPDFDKHRPVLLEKSKGYLAEGHDAQTALGLAVLSVFNDVVLPTRAAASQQTLVEQAVAKSTGSTSTPGSAPSAPGARPTSFEEAFRRVRV